MFKRFSWNDKCQMLSTFLHVSIWNATGPVVCDTICHLYTIVNSSRHKNYRLNLNYKVCFHLITVIFQLFFGPPLFPLVSISTGWPILTILCNSYLYFLFCSKMIKQESSKHTK
jgi:hypothetical protein